MQLLQIFLQINVKAIVRLNESLYECTVFERNGIQVFDLEFPDGSCPDSGTIDRFTRIMQHFDSLG